MPYSENYAPIAMTLWKDMRRPEGQRPAYLGAETRNEEEEEVMGMDGWSGTGREARKGTSKEVGGGRRRDRRAGGGRKDGRH